MPLKDVGLNPPGGPEVPNQGLVNKSKQFETARLF